DHYALGKADLATAFVMRTLDLCGKGGTTALVTPQNWLFLTTYKKLREKLLKENTWNAVSRLGPNAFQDMNWWAATTALIVISAEPCPQNHELVGIDVSSDKRQSEKAAMLRGDVAALVEYSKQEQQLNNPDFRIVTSMSFNGSLLRDFADSFIGMHVGDNDR